MASEVAVAPKSKVLVIGGTGHFGKNIVRAGVKLGHPTFVLARDLNPSDASKAALLQSFKDSGVTVLHGDLYDHESLVKAFKQVDVVISTVGYWQLADQVNLLAAIKEAGNIKRFIPSEFGNDVDRFKALEPAQSTLFDVKIRLRRTIESEGIPFTIVSCNFFAACFLSNLCQPGESTIPREKVTMVGDGNVKAIFSYEEDVGTYTIMAIDDPRTLNKILYVRPAANIYTLNELVSLWEKKIGKELERVYLSDKEVLKKIEESPFILNTEWGIAHAAFVRGCHTNFEIVPSIGVEATKLYPDVEYTTVDRVLDQFV